jgi:hypothetical protein
MMSAQQYMNSPVSSVPCGNLHMPQYVPNQYVDPTLALQLSVQQMQNLVNYPLNYNMLQVNQSMSVNPNMQMNQNYNIPMNQNYNVPMNQNMASQRSLSPPRSVSQTPLLSPTPTTYVDMYGNQMVPVFISSLSPPNSAQYIPISPVMVPTTYPSPSSTHSISPEMFIPNDVCRSRQGSVEATRSRRNSLSSCDHEPMSVVPLNKKELVPKVLSELEQAFQQRFTQTGLRGKDIFRVKCKTKPSLKNILELLQAMDAHIPLKEVSCPASTKKGKRQKRGFLCYVKVDVEHMPMAERLFEEFNVARGMPFNSIEVDPQRKTPVQI